MILKAQQMMATCFMLLSSIWMLLVVWGMLLIIAITSDAPESIDDEEL